MEPRSPSSSVFSCVCLVLMVYRQPHKEGGRRTVGPQRPRGLVQVPLDTKVRGRPSPLVSPWGPWTREADCTARVGFGFCFLSTAVISFLPYARSSLTAESMLTQRSCTSQSGVGAQGGGHRGQAQQKDRESGGWSGRRVSQGESRCFPWGVVGLGSEGTCASHCTGPRRPQS